MKRKTLSMNLQFFADGDEPNKETLKDESKAENKESKPESKADKAENKESKPESKEPSPQELMLEIAKLKRAQEKAASEAAEYKKKWKESLSEQEQASMEKAEAQAKKDEEFEFYKRQNQIHDLTENFMDLGYPKDLAKKAASAQTDNDMAALLEIQKQFLEHHDKEKEADILAKLPETHIGGGSSSQKYTKEEFDNMTMAERTKLKQTDIDEYKRLIAL